MYSWPVTDASTGFVGCAVTLAKRGFWQARKPRFLNSLQENFDKIYYRNYRATFSR